MPDGLPEDAPNIIVIYTDDSDPDWVGCYGGDVLSPNIDRIASEGVRFDRYYASSPVCAPSRYNALTGRYASRSERLQEKFPAGGPINMGWEAGVYGESHTLPQVLSDHGYTTGLVGKWHQMIDIDRIEPVADDADPRDPDVRKTLEHNYQVVLDAVLDSGFDHAASVYESNVRGMEIPEELTYMNMDWVTQGAVEFIEANHEEPFFLFMAPTLTHAPRGRDQVESDPRITPRGYLDEPPDVHPPRQTVLERVEEAGTNGGPVDVTWLDDGVGVVLETLADLGIDEETLVIFTSDHGDIHGKFSCYDGGARQPCLVRWPEEIDPRSPRDELVSNVDLAPTIFDVAGVRPDPTYVVDGQSFTPLLTGDGSYEREFVYLEITTERAVVTDDNYKYIAVRYPPEIQERVDDGERYSHWCVKFDEDVHHTYGAEERYPAYFDQDQLYDLVADPNEQQNLAKDPDHQEKLEELRAILREYCEELPHEFGDFT